MKALTVYFSRAGENYVNGRITQLSIGNTEIAAGIIKPFCTHEGSGMGTSEDDIKKLCPEAIIKRGMSIHGGSVERFKKQIVQWAK